MSENEAVVSSLRRRFDVLKAKRDSLTQNIELFGWQLMEVRQEKEDYVAARNRVVAVGQKTQQLITDKINRTASLALSSVFADPYMFNISFVERRNKSEADIIFKRRDFEGRPEYSSGVGTVDVAAFGLRCSLWSFEKGTVRPILILDEPFKHLRGADNQRRVSEMLKRLSQQFNIQVIMTSDVAFAVEASRFINVELVRGKSKISYSM